MTRPRASGDGGARGRGQLGSWRRGCQAEKGSRRKQGLWLDGGGAGQHPGARTALRVFLLPLQTPAPPAGPVPVLRALTFKVPLLFPPTFTLILLPKENFRGHKRDSDVRRAQEGALFIPASLLPKSSPAPPLPSRPELAPPRALLHSASPAAGSPPPPPPAHITAARSLQLRPLSQKPSHRAPGQRGPGGAGKSRPTH